MLRVFEAFSGVGSQRMALRNLGIEHEVVAIAEIDKYAIQSYTSIHGETKNVGDISKLSMNEIPDHDLFTYSFPCQDISVAGKGAGFSEESDTRSSLLWECKRIIEGKKPKYLLLENVKNLVSNKFRPDFDKWLEWLSSQGYTNHWKVLNAKDFGIPQNRERVFVVSILSDLEFNFPTTTHVDANIKRLGEVSKNSQAGLVYDENGLFPTVIAGTHGYAMGYIAEGFEFPSVQDLTLKLKDLLEPKVDEKYYLSEMVQSRFVYKPKGENVIGTTAPDFRTIGERDKVYHTDGVMGTLMATDYKQPKQIIVAGSLNHYGNDQMNRVHDIERISPTITVPSGGGRQQKILIKNATKQGYLEAHDGDCIDLTYPESKTKRGRVRPQESHTITTKNEYGVISENPFRIRKLTPLETWRLMAFSDSDFKKAKTSGMSDTQLYKQAGNSIVVTVLEAIFTQMFKGR